LVCGAVLSFLGIKTYSSLEEASQKASRLETLVATAEKQFGGLPKRVEELDALLKDAQSRVDEQIKKIDTQQQKLQAQVSNIQERLRFCPTKSVSTELRSSMQEKFKSYIGYLEKVGFQKLDVQVSVCIYSKDDPITDDSLRIRSDEPFGYYRTDQKTIYIHKDMIPTISVALREYTHHALALAGQDASSREVVQDEVESGLADFFPASFVNDPLFGDGAGKFFNLPTSYLRDLANSTRYDKVSPELHDRGEVWSGALWQCRGEIGAETVDKIALQAWRDFNVAKQASPKFFGAALIKAEAATDKKTKCFSRQAAERGLPS
jgi:hypothetical protein